MVVCCVPQCGTKSWRCDPTISFHEFPSNPDRAAKWIKNINLLIINGGMWYPQENSVICSQHFSPSDFKLDCKVPTLKPRSVPSRFERFPGYGFNDLTSENNKRKHEETKSPVIVKVIKLPDDENETNKDSLEHRNDETVKELQHKLQQRLDGSKNLVVNDGSQPQLCITNVSSLSESKFKNLTYGSVNAHYFDSALQNEGFSPIGSSLLITSSQTKGSTNKNQRSLLKPTLSENPNVMHKTGNTKNSRKVVPKRSKFRSKQSGNDLIEIGPSTFLKINPDVIKVAKKVTPSGNTVLQFVMDQNIILSKNEKFLSTSANCVASQSNSINAKQMKEALHKNNLSAGMHNIKSSSEKFLQQVVGHLVDTQSSKATGLEKRDGEFSNDQNDEKSDAPDISTTNENYVADSECISSAPVLLTTNLPVSRCYMNEKERYGALLKQKSRQITSLKLKIGNLSKKVEELENKCIVQERQLSYTSLKKLKTIKKNAEKGERHANYILEQIRGYSAGNKMRWSDSTLRQCSIWCRKAPYAYEYFKKADLFRLPCLGTVKRYFKAHPEIKLQANNCNVDKKTFEDDDSSSDFDFDDSDGSANPSEEPINVAGHNMLDTQCESKNDREFVSSKECALTELNETSQSELIQKQILSNGETTEPHLQSPSTESTIDKATENFEDVTNELTFENPSGNERESNRELSTETPSNETISSPVSNEKDEKSQNLTNELALENASSNELNNETVIHLDNSRINTVDGDVEVQEIILQSGDIVHCLNTNFNNSHEFESQYYIIPSISDPAAFADHQYSVVQQQTDSVIMQNGENEQEQIIFITDTADPQECASVEFSCQ